MNQRLLIVVIDDDPSVCRALQRLLRSAHMDVETFPSGESFLRAPRQQEPDCLVLDVRMPGMTGPELRERLRAAGRPIAVVFITGYAEEENGLAAGGAELLRKPFSDDALLGAILRAVVAFVWDQGPIAPDGSRG